MTNETAIAKPSVDAMLLFDKQDDVAVANRVRGAALKEYVYAFKQGNAMVFGLGIDGAEACKRELARMGEVIREDDIDVIRENPEEAYFRAKASRWAVRPGHPDMLLDTTIELKRQSKYMKAYGKYVPDDFWLEKGGSKAMRNAILNLIPEPIKQKVIDAYKQQAKVIEPTATEVDQATGEIHERADARDAREKKVADIRSLIEELKRPKAWFKTLLRERELSDALADPHVSWSTVDETVVDEILAHLKKEAGK